MRSVTARVTTDRATIEAFEPPSSEAAWEAMWAPYDEATYGAALAQIAADDVVLDIGAGDLRLARRAARICPA